MVLQSRQQNENRPGGYEGRKGFVMEEIILKRQEKSRKPKRTSVVVSPNTYVKVYTLSQDLGMTMEALVDTLLVEALKRVKIEE